MALNARLMPIAFLSGELTLIRAFNRKQEQLIEEFIANIEHHVETMEEPTYLQTHAGDEGELINVGVEQIAGVTEREFDIRILFSENMPMYQRQSMLLTMWAMFECELERAFLVLLAKLGANEILPKKRGGISKFSHILEQLKKRGCLNDCSEFFDGHVTVLDKEVRLIRNAWAHDGGIDIKGKIPDSVVGITKLHSQICISKDYIENALEMINAVSTDVFSSITNKIKGEKKAQTELDGAT